MKKNPQKFKPRRSFLYLGFLFILATLIAVGCSKDEINVHQDDGLDDSIQLSMDLPEVQAVMAVQNQYTTDLMSIPGVVGTATGLNDANELAILALLVDETIASQLPSSLDGVPVHPYVTGEITKLKGPPGGGGGGGGGGGSFDPTNKYRPAPNGVSIGHPDITAGTLGCLVNKNGSTYILSNNHVMANENQANIGDDIYQPGPFDGGTSADAIATLSDFVEVKFDGTGNLVDAAIALVSDTDVTGATDANAGSYGAPSTTSVQPAINLGVQKYGRTTQQTSASITGINANVNVGFSQGTALFTGQFVIQQSNREVRKNGSFSAGGDSGSLIVSSSGDPVGLLFAGSSTSTIGNPIDVVLDQFGVSLGAASGGSN
jgi:hypothetical protein